MARELELSTEQAGAILSQVGLVGLVAVAPLKQRNHVWRLESAGQAFFLKAHTKPWYADDPTAGGFAVLHEAAAWACLAAHGLAIPDVLLAQPDRQNPLGHPFLLTRALHGAPFTAYGSDGAALSACLECIGQYLRRMHTITFACPGYIMDTRGPMAPPDPTRWHHRCWTAQQRQRDAVLMLEREAPELPPAVISALEPWFVTMAARLMEAYDPPHFVHGDCHAHQFFVGRTEAGWRVAGLVDLEVASNGDSAEDLLKVCVELAPALPATTRWWESLFAGYGGVPDFDLVRLRLLGMSGAEFRVTGWPGTRAEILTHILEARSWAALFTLNGQNS
jgi:aminoglycoside phosphotransferase